MLSTSRWLLIVALACGALAATAVPAGAQGDPTRAVGGDSLLCGSPELDAASRALCSRTGSPAQPHPTSHYGLDNHGGGLKDVIGSALQSLVKLIWMLLLWGMKLVMFLLEAALTIDLVGNSMPQVGAALERFSDDFGPWISVALVCLGAWGVVGVFRGQATQTIAGVGTSVLLMIAGLAIVHEPRGTVGRFTALINDASLSVLAIASGHGGDSLSGLIDVERTFMGGTVSMPACVMNVGSAKLCQQPVTTTLCPKAAGEPQRTPTRAPWRPGHTPPQQPTSGLLTLPQPSTCTLQDLYLSTPSGSPQRNAIYQVLKGDAKPPDRDEPNPFADKMENMFDWAFDGDSPDEVREKKYQKALQEWKRLQAPLARYQKIGKDTVGIQDTSVNSVVDRATLLVLFAIAFIAATLLLAKMGIRIFMAKGKTLLLLLTLPLLLLAPAFGEAGRSMFVQGIANLAKAILDVLCQVFLLSIFLLGATFLPSLNSDHVGVSAVIMAAYFFGLNMYLDELNPWGTHASRKSLPRMVGMLGSAFLASRVAKAGWNGFTRVTGIQRHQANNLDHAEAQREFAEAQRDAELEAQASAAVNREWDDQVADARGTLAGAEADRRQLDVVGRELSDLDSRIRNPRPDPLLVDKERELGDERRGLRSELQSLDRDAASTERDLQRSQTDLEGEQANLEKLRQLEDHHRERWAEAERDEPDGRASIAAQDRVAQLEFEREALERKIAAKRGDRLQVLARQKTIDKRRDQVRQDLATVESDLSRATADRQASSQVSGADIARRDQLVAQQRALEARLRSPEVASAQRVLADAERGAGPSSQAIRDRAEQLRTPRTYDEVVDDKRFSRKVNSRRRNLR